MKLDQYLAQHDAFDHVEPDVLGFMSNFYDPNTGRAKSSGRIADFLRLYANEAAKVSSETGLGLEMPKVAPHDIIETAAAKTQEPRPAGVRQGNPNERPEKPRPKTGKGRTRPRKKGAFRYGRKLGEPDQYFSREQPAAAAEHANGYGSEFGEHGTSGGPNAGGQSDLFSAEPGADNRPQLVIPGAERRPTADVARLRAAAPLRPRVAQKPLESGLFGEQHKQSELFGAQKPAQGKAAAPAPEKAAPAEPKPLEVYPGEANTEARIYEAPDSKSFNTTLFDKDSGETAGPIYRTPTMDQARAKARDITGAPNEPGDTEPSVRPESQSVTKPPRDGKRVRAQRRGSPGASRGLAEAQDKIAERSKLNYRITDEDHIGEGGPKAKVRGNLDAIKIIKQL